MDLRFACVLVMQGDGLVSGNVAGLDSIRKMGVEVVEVSSNQPDRI